jgi:hypothetical protein
MLPYDGGCHFSDEWMASLILLQSSPAFVSSVVLRHSFKNGSFGPLLFLSIEGFRSYFARPQSSPWLSNDDAGSHR